MARYRLTTPIFRKGVYIKEGFVEVPDGEAVSKTLVRVDESDAPVAPAATKPSSTPAPASTAPADPGHRLDPKAKRASDKDL